MLCNTLETAHAAVCKLVHDFAENEAHYLSPGYSEAQARVSFIDKLWQALGWDVTHQQQRNPYAQEVKVEDPQKISGHSRRADYAFHTAPNFRDARFFCEAKKPAVQLKADKDAAFQTIRYGWSAGTPLAVLTDFEQFHILDCRAKPDIDTALARSIRYFHYKDWLDPQKFAELYYLFSREAFRDGGFDAYVSKLPRPKKVGKQLGLLRTGSQPVDAAFLIDLEEYRETLAKLLKAADHSLDGDALTELVQRTLDRLVFLRFLEDKLIETEIQVQHFSRAAGGQAWRKFLAASRKLDTRYNGIVFKYHPILDDPAKLPVDDARFADLCEELSHTKSPYDFNAIPIHILGSIYERFLGSVIVTTAQRATVEQKPEVRKAGGVYYTPEYIVRYICEQTVGKLIDGKTPAQIAKMRFADIACGSGSFLLGIYDLLLRYHGTWYNAHPDEAKKENLAPPEKSKKRKKEHIPAVTEREGVLRLTLEKKREILLNNVFGVDLDPQAVEVAQLSLYLKLLEDETTATAAQHYLDFHEALLPSLNKNVIRGNSLIGTDILFGQFEFSAQEERKLAPMDFESAFPHIFSGKWVASARVAEPTDGEYIDVGPGEPTRDMAHYALLSDEPEAKPSPRRKSEATEEGTGFDAIVGNPPYGATLSDVSAEYVTSKYLLQQYQLDTYLIFLERVLGITKQSGLIGLIIPNTWLLNIQMPKIRRRIFGSTTIAEIVHFNDPVFEQATVDTQVLVLSPAIPIENHEVVVHVADKDRQRRTHKVRQSRWRDLGGSIVNILERPESSLIGDRLRRFAKLSEGFKVTQGSKPFQVGKGKPPQTRAIVDAKPFVKETKEDDSFRPLLRGSLIHRYTTKWNNDYWISFGDWLAEPRYSASYEVDAKIVIRQTGDSLIATLDERRFVVRDNLYTIVAKSKASDLRVLLGLLNSTLLKWYYQNIVNPEAGEALAQVKRTHLDSLPIPSLDLKNPAQKQQHDRMVQLVEMMLTTQQQLAAAANENDRTYLDNKAAGLDRQIDELTYDLYGLTQEERDLVQAS